jgi:hypothetical protein
MQYFLMIQYEPPQQHEQNTIMPKKSSIPFMASSDESAIGIGDGAGSSCFFDGDGVVPASLWLGLGAAA